MGDILVTSNWRDQLPTFGDAIVYSAILFIIALVSWLFNREMERALQRARRSEAALKRQRDHLEVMVTKRTRELQRVQSEKLLQLHRFAELGRLASGLFHDLVNPLNAVSLTLNRLQHENQKVHSEEDINRLVQRASIGAQQIETFITAARKQIQNQEILQIFSLKHEINQAIQILDYKAKTLQVTIIFNFTRDIRAFGNPIKFCQLITNLVSNGIEAYENSEKKSKKVEVDLKRIKQTAVITIHDWGSGIKPDDLPKVFDPLFTTKDFEKGTGIGLSMCKDTVEKYFHGTLQVISDKKNGTMFTVTFPIKRAPVGKLLTEDTL
jgi:signal transduction histidine kinase